MRITWQRFVAAMIALIGTIYVAGSIVECQQQVTVPTPVIANDARRVPLDIATRLAAGERVHIIVGVQAPFIPQGQLPDAASVSVQHVNIQVAQDAFLSRLQPYAISHVTRFDGIPYIALTVDQIAVEAIAADPEVTYIGSNRLAWPQLAPPSDTPTIPWSKKVRMVFCSFID